MDGLFGVPANPELVGMTAGFVVPLIWAPPGNYPIGVIVQASSGVWSDPAFTVIMILPEPGTFTLLAIGGLGLWRRRRRGR